MAPKIIDTADEKVSVSKKNWERIMEEIKIMIVVKKETFSPENARSQNFCKVENGRPASIKRTL